MEIIGVIPARYGSTRLEGKPLKDICGKPMIQYVYEQASKSKLIERLIVATDDDRIIRVVEDFGGEAIMTSKNHTTGSDRVAEVANKIDCSIVVNIQGDEPLIMPEIIDEITEAVVTNPEIPMSTGAYQIFTDKMFQDPNVVKVVTDINNIALYFSRSLIPYPREGNSVDVFEHIGIYAFKKEFLLKYIELDNTPLSIEESLEQLKVLENGYKIIVVKTKYEYTAISVDTMDDLNEVRRIVNARKN